MPDPIAFAVPFFFVLIGLELLWAKRRGVSVYRFTDTLTDLELRDHLAGHPHLLGRRAARHLRLGLPARRIS